MLRFKVDFPSLFFVTLTGVLIFASLLVVRFHQSKYFVESLSPGILSSAFSEEEAQSFQDESVITMQQIAVQTRPNKQYLDLVTFVLWFVFGIVAYYLCYGFYATFIHPFSSDAAESHFIHADKKSLVKKRVLWFMAVGFTAFLIFGAITVYRSIVLTYYIAAIYNPGLVNWAMLLGSIAITSLMVSFIRLGCRVVIRAY